MECSLTMSRRRNSLSEPSRFVKRSGSEHPETATSLNDLARLHQTRAHLPIARKLFERSLAIRERILGAEHPETATTLNDLGRLLRRYGDFAGARIHINEHSRSDRRFWGPVAMKPHQVLTTSVGCSRRKGDLDQARSLFERALEMARRRIRCSQHTHTAGTMGILHQF